MALHIENGEQNAIRYDLSKNALVEKNKGERSYYARVYTTTKSLKTVAEAMVREGLKYSQYEIYCILEAFTDVVTRLLKEGYAVNMGSLVRFRPSIQGSFKTEQDGFTRGDHRIVVRASVGSSLRNVAASAAVARISAAWTPEIHEIHNGMTGEENTVAPDGSLVITGTRLKWNTSAADEGFFANLDGDELRCTVMSTDTTNNTIFILLPHTLVEGQAVELTFRTRTTPSGELAMIDYPEVITCVASQKSEN
jgi:hypothetical protein